MLFLGAQGTVLASPLGPCVQAVLPVSESSKGLPPKDRSSTDVLLVLDAVLPRSSGKGPRTRRPHLSPPARPCWGSGRLRTLLRLGFVEGLDNSGLAGLSSLLPSPGETRVWGGCKPQLYLSGSCWNLRDGPDSASCDPPQASYLSQINPEIEGGVHIQNCARESLCKAIRGQTLVGCFFTGSAASPCSPNPGP